MKILQVNNNHYIKGGSDTVYFGDSESLANRGHEIYQFSSGHVSNHASKYSDHFPIAMATSRRRLKDAFRYCYNFDAAASLRQMLDEYGSLDIAHLHIYYGQLTTSILPILRKRAIPVVQTLHEYKLVCPIYTLERGGSTCTKCLKGSTFNAVLNRCKNGSFIDSGIMLTEFWVSRGFGDIRLIDTFICVSQFQMNIMESAGIPKHKLKLLYNCVNTDFLSPEEDETSHHDYLLYFGRIESLKGLATLLSAVKQTGDQLVIIGSGSWEPRLQSEISQMKNVSYLGYMAGAQLHNYVRNAKAVVSPSEWYENCPMSIIESKSLGTPVIASKIGGQQELVRDSVDGYLFEPRCVESLVEALEKYGSSKRDDMSKNAREDACERFSVERHVKGLECIYNELL